MGEYLNFVRPVIMSLYFCRIDFCLLSIRVSGGRKIMQKPFCVSMTVQFADAGKVFCFIFHFLLTVFYGQSALLLT